MKYAQYTEDGSETRAQNMVLVVSGGSSAFEDEAYGGVSLARNDSQPHFWVEITSFQRFLRPPIKERMRTREKNCLQ